MELHINKSAPTCQQNLLAKQDEFLNKIGAIPPKLVQHLEKFMDRTNLWSKSGRAYLAVSSGADSMFLLNLFWRLRKKGRIKELVILHVNHGTRPENDAEENFLREYACALDIPIFMEHLKLDPQKGNFEDLARQARYAFFDKKLKQDDLLYLGHHIDDSLEWSLLSGFKSGEIRGRLGIPLKRGKIARPLFCFTRQQIRYAMKINALPFFDDKSNEDVHFERNFIRRVVLPKIKKRFPSYLKHYVTQSNSLAKKLGVSLMHREEDCEIFNFAQGTLLRKLNEKMSFPEEVVKKTIFNFSHEKRGRVGGQLKKLEQAIQGQKWGPLTFSGGVEVHIRPGHLYIGREVATTLHDLDLVLLDHLKKTVTAQIPLDLNSSSNSKLNLIQSTLIPYQFSLHNQELDQIRESLKKTDPLFPLSTSFATRNGLWFYYKSKIINDKKLAKRESLFCTF